MNTYRIWLSAGIICALLIWSGIAQDADKGILGSDKKPILKKLNATGLKRPPAPILVKPENISQEEIDTTVPEEAESDVGEEQTPAGPQPHIFPTTLPPVPSSPGLQAPELMIGLKYEDMDLDEVLKQYSDWTGIALMKAPNVPAVKITL